MFDESIITIIFRLINFAALAGLFYYIFIKYLLPDINSDIKNHEQKIEIQQESINQLENRSNQLSQQILDQEVLCSQLMQRVEQWRLAFERESEHKKHDLGELQMKTTMRFKKQQSMMAHKKIMSIVVPKALEKAEQEEISHFSHDTAHASYIREIIAHVKKS